MAKKQKLFKPDGLERILGYLGPILKFDPAYAITLVGQAFPSTGEAWRQGLCSSCGASRAIYEFRLDIHDVKLLQRLASEVLGRLRASGSDRFTESNRAHVQSLDGLSYALKSRTTQCRMLGLIAKVKSPTGKQVPGTWLITERGWAGLRGEPVPAYVHSHRNRIEKDDKPVEQTTFGEVMRRNSESYDPEPYRVVGYATYGVQ